MEQIKIFGRSQMRNDEHFQFYTEVIKLINRAGADTLNIEPQFAEMQHAHRLAAEAIRKVRASALTEEVQLADRQRNTALAGMNDKLRAAQRHFNPEVQRAARSLKTVFDTHKNLARLPLKEKTAAVTNFLQELRGRFFADVQTASMEEWLCKLEASNNALATIMRDRRDEAIDKKPQVPMKTARKMQDDAYNVITQRINALVVVEGDGKYREFIVAMNKLITVFRNAMARRG
jgi:hypothetical protein